VECAHLLRGGVILEGYVRVSSDFRVFVNSHVLGFARPTQDDRLPEVPKISN